MSWRRRAGGYKRDIAERPIVDALEGVGARTWLLQGKGCPDLLVLFRGVYTPLEIKTGKGKRTANQQDIPWSVVTTPDEALKTIGAVA